MCRDHRRLTECQKQNRQNEPAGQVDDTTKVYICVIYILDMCRDHRCLTVCQNQHRQNKPTGQVDVSTSPEVYLTGDPGQM